jgi:hypothetical protein
MFEKIKSQWHQARGEQLKKEYDDAVIRIKLLTEEGNERFCKSLDYAFNHWTTAHGLIERAPEGLRKAAAKELRSSAKQRHDSGDLGVSYGFIFLSLHIEASCLPGAEAMSVYQSTSDWISLVRRTVQKTAGQ